MSRPQNYVNKIIDIIKRKGGVVGETLVPYLRWNYNKKHVFVIIIFIRLLSNIPNLYSFSMFPYGKVHTLHSWTSLELELLIIVIFDKYDTIQLWLKKYWYPNRDWVKNLLFCDKYNSIGTQPILGEDFVINMLIYSLANA